MYVYLVELLIAAAIVVVVDNVVGVDFVDVAFEVDFVDVVFVVLRTVQLPELLELYIPDSPTDSPTNRYKS